MATPTRTRDERGAVLPSPVVLLSIVAVALAAVAFVATRGDQPAERDISATKAAATPTAEATDEPTDTGAESSGTPTEEEPAPPPVVRGDHAVVVFNNTAIRGLAGRVSEKVKAAGWKVAAADNWYGTVPATTVYFPKGKKAVAQQLALDLGVARVLPADTDSDMSDTNLTVILTGELD